MTEEPLTLESFLSEHPWPAAMLEEGKPIEYLWRFDLDASLEGMWTHVSNTSRFNRALGLSEMSFDERAGLMHGESNAGGLKHEWVEPPWDWVKGRVMVAQRRYTRGFSKIVRTIFVFQELGPKRVRLYMYFGWIPRNLVWGWLLRLGMVPFQWRVKGLLEELARHDSAADPAVLTQSVSPLPEPVQARIDEHRRDLLARGLSDEAIDNLVSLIQGGDEMDLERLQPRKLARDWQLSEREVLRACLHGTRVGLLAMSWDVICPHCRGVRAELKNLGEVPKAGACEACAIDFGTDAPEAIEITFHVHPSIRKVSRMQFCAAQLAGKRHIEVQQVLAPGERRVVPTSLTSGRHRVRVRGQLDVGYLLLAPDHEHQQCTWRASDAPEEHPLKPEPTLEIDNDTDREQIFIVEEVSWADDALRPMHLFSFQEFRDLFSEQYIGADVQLSVGEQTILFTDIVGSTSLYIDRGDPEAFVKVRKHFAQVFKVIDDHEGAVVKTIGDATMAAFSSAAHALSAAAELHRVFAPGSDIVLRISINTGVCIAVNLNSNIDYFGNSVNFAAKLQLCAGAGDVVLSESTYALPSVSKWIQEHDARFDQKSFQFLGKATPAWRWSTHAGTQLAASGSRG